MGLITVLGAGGGAPFRAPGGGGTFLIRIRLLLIIITPTIRDGKTNSYGSGGREAYSTKG